MGPILAQFNHIQSKQPLDKYEGAGIPFRPENNSCLTQRVYIKNILKLNPKDNQRHVSPI